MKKIQGIKFLGAVVDLPLGTDTALYSFGYITLSHKGRDFAIDTDWLYISDEDSFTRVELDLDLDVNEDDISTIKWDLIKEDLLAEELEAVLYIGEDEYEHEPLSMKLVVEIDGVHTEIDLEKD